MKRVFLSFIVEDKDKVNGVRLLASNPRYNLEFYDESVQVPYNSSNADYIKSQIREKIRRASITTCFISEQTHTSRWVDWELEESERQGNQIIAMAVKGVNQAVLPTLIKQKNLPFHPWDMDSLIRLVCN